MAEPAGAAPPCNPFPARTARPGTAPSCPYPSIRLPPRRRASTMARHGRPPARRLHREDQVAPEAAADQLQVHPAAERILLPGEPAQGHGDLHARGAEGREVLRGAGTHGHGGADQRGDDGVGHDRRRRGLHLGTGPGIQGRGHARHLRRFPGAQRRGADVLPRSRRGHGGQAAAHRRCGQECHPRPPGRGQLPERMRRRRTRSRTCWPSSSR